MKFCPTLVQEYLVRSAQNYPEKTALICGDERLTYADLNNRSSNLAWTLNKMGVRRHDRVIIFLDNSVESIIALYGVLKAGSTFVMLNGSLKAPKLTYIGNDSGAVVIIAHISKRATIQAALPEIKHNVNVIWTGDPVDGENIKDEILSWKDALQGPDTGQVWEEVNSIDSDLATLIYTSGSTGEPKGVMSSHHNVISAARSIIQYLENSEDDIVIVALPLSFDYGLYQVIMAIMYGGTIVLERAFVYPVEILNSISRESVTGFPLVPTIVVFLLMMENLDQYDLSSLRYMTNTGAALPVDHILRLKKLFPDIRLYSMFGLTECKRVCYLPPEELARRPSSVGKAMPNCEVFLVDEQGNEVKPGEIGEMIVRGANVMRGYWNAPELTDRTYRTWKFPGEKILFTGDYFRKDEQGFLYFLGRRDDMIKSRGERVSPKEVENIICKHPGVAESAVIGIEDEIQGQAIKVFLVKIAGAKLSERDILMHCRKNLEIFMVPKYFVFMDNLPKTPNGKIDKEILKTIV